MHIPNSLLGKELSEEQQQKLEKRETIYVAGMKDKKGEEFNAYIKVNDEKGKLDFYKWNPDKAQTKGAEVIPDNKSKTQVAVNSEGKSNEATKDVKEPLKKDQVNPTERQQTTKRNRSKSHSM
ncbi:topoisomerase C-terminal repeat-containing protein [Draconibacterium mangrovi]|uniref:topoisomerase C-terminal repeat-containing protein n=1 Tax=Draconibacterium mangrovi TaxID=2697469 RepID=UPI0013D4FB3F